MESPRIQNALISVSDKTGLTRFAAALAAAGVAIYSTGGTRRHLESEGLAVHDIASYTGFPEMMDGRVKTLHPKVFAGILCRYDRDEDLQSLKEHEIKSFELVVVNLYPFEQTVARPGVTDAEAVEQIDIGGPSLVRAAAKNHAFTSIITESSQYQQVLAEIQRDQCTSWQTRRELAATAFARTAAYDRAIAAYFAGCLGVESGADSKETGLEDLGHVASVASQSAESSLLRDTIAPVWKKRASLRYGENPHQSAALYVDSAALGVNSAAETLVNARQLNGKELSYNNYLDLDAALRIVRSLPAPGAVVIKHTNPCGAATAETLVAATEAAMAGDPVSAFGSILGFNLPVDVPTAELLAQPGLFVEAIIAPGFSEEALEILTSKPKWKKNVRLMTVEDRETDLASLAIRQIDGGMLLQEADTEEDQPDTWRIVTDQQPSAAAMDELRFAWTLVRHVKSNAIVITNQRSLRGAGIGQTSRVDAVEHAIDKAGSHVAGAALASDAFFPFADSIERAAAAGIQAIIQPGGSRKDDDVIKACNLLGLSMVFTGKRHFKH